MYSPAGWRRGHGPGLLPALHALVDVHHGVAGRADVLHVLAGVHAEGDQAEGPDAAGQTLVLGLGRRSSWEKRAEEAKDSQEDSQSGADGPGQQAVPVPDVGDDGVLAAGALHLAGGVGGQRLHHHHCRPTTR